MEKLILRGVMWGADRIPDKVFESIPGGYYKTKEEEHRKQKSADMKKRRSRRHSDDEYDEDDSRHSRDDGYRSEGHGKHSTPGKYDGGDDYDSINNRPRRRRSKPRRHRDENDKYGHGDGYSRRDRRNGADGVEYGSGVVPPEQQAHPIPPGVDPYVAGAAAAAGAAGVQAAQGVPGSPFSDPRSPQQPPSSIHSGATFPPRGSTSTLRGGMATGYVPYAHIYGGPAQSNGYQNFAPPPSDTGSVQPNFLNQVAAPVARQQNYQQNPYAQEYPPGTQPGYVPDPYWKERQYQHSEHGSRRDRRRKDDYESSEDSRSPPRSRRSRRSRRDRSDSRDRYSDDDRKGARSERRSNESSDPARGSRTVRPPPPPVFVNPHKSLAPQMAYTPSPSPPHSRKKEEMRSRARSGYNSD